MDRSARRALIAAALIFPVILSALAADTESDDSRAAYKQWVATYAAKSLDGSILQITLVGDARPLAGPSTYTFTVKSDGQIQWQSCGAFEVRGGNGNPVAPQSMKRLQELISQLPADPGSLPPPERRILIQTLKSTYVYDRAEFADPVAEILRLSGCGIGSWRPTFEPQSKIDARAFGSLTLCPNGKSILCGTQLLALPTYETLGALDVDGGYTDMAFSPDGMVVVLSRFDCQIVDFTTGKLIGDLSDVQNDRGWRNLGDPHFTPDGRCLVLCTGQRGGLCFIDTKTWKPVDPIPEIPDDAVQWKPSKSWRHAVMRAKPDVIRLWDAKSKSARDLDPSAFLLDASFSPDESQVVLLTCDKKGYSNPHLRIFETDTGKLVHELRVGEIGGDGIRLPRWTADGCYVLAVTKPDKFFSNENVSLWSAKTGRHLADFVSGIAYSFLLLPPGDQLVADCDKGMLYTWDFKAATEKIAELEKSFKTTTVP
jgi:WD40 repeat protein